MIKLFVSAKALLARKEAGATMVEYGLMLALIAAVCLAAVGLVGTQASAIFQQIQASL
jgi:pilus assembly protein Flp/PilA